MVGFIPRGHRYVFIAIALENVGRIILTVCICQILSVISDNTRQKSKEFAAKLHMVISRLEFLVFV